MSTSHLAALRRGTAITVAATALLAPAAHAAGPVVTGIDTQEIPSLATGQITISGSGFTGATSVDSSGRGASDFIVVSDHTIRAAFDRAASGGTKTVHVTAGGITSPDTPLAQYRSIFQPRPRPTTTALTCKLGGDAGATFAANLDASFGPPATGSWPAGSTPLGLLSADLTIPNSSPLRDNPLGTAVGDATVTSIDADVIGAADTSVDFAAGAPAFTYPVPSSLDGNQLAFPAAAFPNASVVSLQPIIAPTPFAVLLRGYHARVPLSGGTTESLDCTPSTSSRTLQSATLFPPYPTVGYVTPDPVPTQGGPVQLRGSGFVSGMVVRIDNVDMPDAKIVSDSLIELTAPAHAAGPARIAVGWPGDQGGVWRSFTYAGPDPFPTPAPPVSLGLKGSATLKTLAKGSVPLTGSLTGAFAADAFTGDLALNPATANLVAYGFLPVTAKLAFSQLTPTTGTLSSAGALATSTKVRIKLPSIKLFGIELVSGSTCQAANPTILGLKSAAFTAAGGGSLTGTFAISNLSGCGALNGIVSPLTAGTNNAIALSATPAAPAAG